eukprot:492137-Pelagomonas_calceolata.AAC.6
MDRQRQPDSSTHDLSKVKEMTLGGCVGYQQLISWKKKQKVEPECEKCWQPDKRVDLICCALV